MDEGRQCRSVRPNNLWPNEIAQSDDLTLLIAFSDYLSDFEANVFRRRHASSAASANSQSRKIAIFGFIEVALGQTIQYVLDNFKLKINRAGEPAVDNVPRRKPSCAQAQHPGRQRQDLSACSRGSEPNRETFRHWQRKPHPTTATTPCCRRDAATGISVGPTVW